MTNEEDDFNLDDLNLEERGGEAYPTHLLDLLEASKNKWRKGIIKEFILDYVWKCNVENKLKKISRENKAVIALLTALLLVALKMAFFGGV